ncbi:MAG: hypothetical protein ACUVS1_08050, partial [Actinomycetota bacterium]
LATGIPYVTALLADPLGHGFSLPSLGFAFLFLEGVLGIAVRAFLGLATGIPYVTALLADPLGQFMPPCAFSLITELLLRRKFFPPARALKRYRFPCINTIHKFGGKRPKLWFGINAHWRRCLIVT